MQYLRELFCHLFGHELDNVEFIFDTAPHGLSTLTKSCSCCGVTLETITVREKY